jgi:hypothetical protein
LGAAAIKPKLASPIPLDFKKYRLSIIAYLKKHCVGERFRPVWPADHADKLLDAPIGEMVNFLFFAFAGGSLYS